MSGGPGECSDLPPLRVASLYAQSPRRLLGQAIGALGVALLLGLGQDGVRLWLGVALLVCLARWRLQQAYQHRPVAQVTDWRRWQHRWSGLTLLATLVWGLALVAFYEGGDATRRLALLAATAGLCLGDPAAPPRFAGAMAALMTLVAAWQSLTWGIVPAQGALPAVPVLAVLVGAGLIGQRHRCAFGRLLVLQQRAELLAAQLAAEKDVAEEARAAAEAATQERTRFFSAASHDLRQPLHALVLFTESLRQRNRDPALAAPIGQIIGAVDALEVLFDKLLDLTSIDSGAVRIEPRSFRLREVYARLRLHFEPLAFDKGLALDFHGGRQAAMADPILVERILRNLVSNAIRHTHDGGVLVSCRRRGGQLLLQVWDTGVGIEAAVLPRIFDEFYQVGTTPEAAVPRKGLGLGLAIARRLSDLLGTVLTVRSRVGHGTVFSLVLPPASDAEVEAVVRQAVPVPAWNSPTLQGRHVLLVGAGLAAAGDGLDAMLRGWGAAVSLFDDVSSVLAWAPSRAEVPGLLIVERTLPQGRCGVDLVRSLQQVFGQTLPTILVADERDGVLDAAALAADGLHLLQRPVAPNRLRAMVGFKLGPSTAATATGGGLGSLPDNLTILHPRPAATERSPRTP